MQGRVDINNIYLKTLLSLKVADLSISNMFIGAKVSGTNEWTIQWNISGRRTERAPFCWCVTCGNIKFFEEISRSVTFQTVDFHILGIMFWSLLPLTNVTSKLKTLPCSDKKQNNDPWISSTKLKLISYEVFQR